MYLIGGVFFIWLVTREREIFHRLSVENVYQKYGDFDVLNDISFLRGRVKSLHCSVPMVLGNPP